MSDKEKDQSALRWFEDYGDYLYGYAMSRVNKVDLAEDLVQDCLLSAWKSRDSFKGKSSAKTWLTSILRRKIIDYYRSSSKRKETSWEDFQSPYHSEGPMKGHWIDSRVPKSWGDNPDSIFQTKEFMIILDACLSDLPDRWKSVLSLKVFEELNTDEICKELDISASNLWVLMHRAKVKLRECLEKNWFKEEKDEDN